MVPVPVRMTKPILEVATSDTLDVSLLSIWNALSAESAVNCNKSSTAELPDCVVKVAPITVTVARDPLNGYC